MNKHVQSKRPMIQCEICGRSVTPGRGYSLHLFYMHPNSNQFSESSSLENLEVRFQFILHSVQVIDDNLKIAQYISQ